MSISRQLARMMGGDITVKSTFCQGSIFSFKFACREDSGENIRYSQLDKRIKGVKNGQQKFSILVVDDKSSNRELLTDLLGNVGFDTREAVNGKEAVEIFKQCTLIS